MNIDFRPLLLAALGAGLAFAATAQQAAGATTPTPPSPPMTEGATMQPQQAQQPQPHGMREADPAARVERRVQRMQIRIAQHLAGLKVKLNLTPAQQGAWAAFSSAVTPAPDRLMRMAQLRQSMRTMNTPERIDRMRELRAERTAAMDRRFDATRQFYAQLSPAQQKTFDENALPKRGGKGRHEHAMHGRHQHGGSGDHSKGERMR